MFHFICFTSYVSYVTEINSPWLWKQKRSPINSLAGPGYILQCGQSTLIFSGSESERIVFVVHQIAVGRKKMFWFWDKLLNCFSNRACDWKIQELKMPKKPSALFMTSLMPLDGAVRKFLPISMYFNMHWNLEVSVTVLCSCVFPRSASENCVCNILISFCFSVGIFPR